MNIGLEIAANFSAIARVEYRDWEKAFYEVIPSRKFNENRSHRQNDQDVEESGTASEDHIAVSTTAFADIEGTASVVVGASI